MCLALLPTSLAQHSHSYGMDSEISEMQWDLHTVFCIGHNFETIISSVATGVSFVNIRLLPFSTSDNIRFYIAV